MRERGFATHTGDWRGATHKAWRRGQPVHFADGSIDAAASNARRAETKDPDWQRRPVGKTTLSGPGENRSYLMVRTALMIYQPQEHRIDVVSKAMSRDFQGGQYKRLLPSGAKRCSGSQSISPNQSSV